MNIHKEILRWKQWHNPKGLNRLIYTLMYPVSFIIIGLRRAIKGY